MENAEYLDHDSQIYRRNKVNLMAMRHSNAELLKLPDCDGLFENGKCRWLNVSKCNGTKCSYYQTVNSLDKAQERLRSLDEATQERIAKKYYGGSRPWVDTRTKSRR